MIEPNFREILPLLIRHNVRFVVIGGGAAIAHGLARTTYDVDVVYARDPGNIHNLVEALRPYQHLVSRNDGNANYCGILDKRD
jgi:hypothetical protein